MRSMHELMRVQRMSSASSLVEKSIRYRVNVSISVKGQKTWDCTVDGQGYSQEEVLAESDKLVAELEKRYPPTIEGK